MGQLKSLEKTKFKEPTRYNVIMHNDDFTTMDFVVMLLMKVFRKDNDAAEAIMIKIHTEGKAVVGNYPLDIAMAKVEKSTALARENGFPLYLSYEPDTI